MQINRTYTKFLSQSLILPTTSSTTLKYFCWETKITQKHKNTSSLVEASLDPCLLTHALCRHHAGRKVQMSHSASVREYFSRCPHCWHTCWCSQVGLDLQACTKLTNDYKTGLTTKILLSMQLKTKCLSRCLCWLGSLSSNRPLGQRLQILRCLPTGKTATGKNLVSGYGSY